MGKSGNMSPFDWYRIAFGQAPVEFVAEVAVRTLVTYVLLLVAMKLLGKRMVGQLTVTEMAVVITLGAIVSLPMQQATRGIVQGAYVLLLAVMFQRGLGWMDFVSGRFEIISQGRSAALVKEGRLELEQLKRCGVSRGQLFALLRAQDIFNLGQVKRCYLEACGATSIYRFPGARPGLSLLYPGDGRAREVLSGESDQVLACCGCGETVSAGNDDSNGRACPRCGASSWDRAVK